MQDQFVQGLDARITRRSALQGAAAIGAAGVFGASGLRPAHAQGAEDPFGYPDLPVIAIDHAFEMPSTAEAGWTHVIMDNQGMMDHHAMFLRPHDGSTIEDIQAAIEQGDIDGILATATSAGGPSVGSGRQASVAMYLEAGPYLVVCLIPNEDGIPHVALGMHAVLEVTEETAERAAPAADARVNLVEMAFEGVPAEATAGSHVWEVGDFGTQLHELAVLQLAEGVTIDQAMQGFIELSPPPSTMASPVVDQDVASPPAGPPFVAIGGNAPMSPGETNYVLLDLVAGDYVAFCFVPDAETGAPHSTMGMVAGFTVT